MFKKVNPRQNFPEMEKNIMNFWREDKIFEKSVSGRGGSRPAPTNGSQSIPTYSFFDGPPFATGMPHYGHVVASLIKDVVPRFWTMRGYKVERRWGWDCHGLPIENLIEKEQDIKNKQEIEDMGVDKFNEACCNSVLRYADEWKKFIPRIGRWVDMENDYRTMDWKYTESIWWVFSELYKKGLIYEGHKAMHICPRCETTLSNFEVTQGYKEITDLSATVKFKLKYPTGKTGRGVGALIYNDKNEVLLLRRNENGRRKTWAMPGGKVDGNETFREALEREVMEELGVKIESAEPFISKPDIFEGRLFETVCFKVKIKGEPTIKEKEKVDKLEWFSLDDLPEINYPPSRDALEVYGQNKKVFHFDIDVSKLLSSVYVLAWTTTPWTLPGNVALAVGDSIKYQVVSIKGEDDFYILAKDRVGEILKDKEFEILNEIDGEELVDLEYEPLFNYYSKKEDLKNKENGWKIYAGDFVTTEEGTGVVHIAPAFGDDDMKLAEKYNLPFVQHVGMDGRFKEEVVDFRDKNEAGIEVKPKGKDGEKDPHMKTDIEIIKYLAHNNNLFSKKKIEHSYPHCWRCDTPLLNYATSSWFVKVTEIRDRMVKNNKEINWTPEYLKEGRFGKWLEDARDWAVSRSRYWGAPLPVWRCEKCKNIEVINSIDDLREKTDQKVTKLILLRHGESENNVKDIKAGQPDGYPLTKKGIKQVEDTAEILKKEKIDIIISSPILRTKQTADIVNDVLKIERIEDGRIKEYNFGSWNGHNTDDLFCKKDKIYQEYKKLKYDEKKYNFKFGGDGESRKEIEERVREFTEEIAEKYAGKNILVVGHGGINAMFHRIIKSTSIKDTYKYEFTLDNAKCNVFYIDENKKEFNLHKPNIDKIKIKCSKCGGEAKIVGDVFDCWFESGSMPYAQWHYPFENEDKFTKGFPAEFIAEGLDQTRGWFYTLMVLSTALFDKPAFRNVIVNGIVLAEDGQKMSKRLKNYPEPNLLIEKYGADALRYYLLTSPVMKAENLRFSERGVEEVLKKFVLTLWNTYSFLVMNADGIPHTTDDEIPPAPFAKGGDKNIPPLKRGAGGIFGNSPNLLDKWIISEFNILVEEVNKQMENYDLAKAARPMREFVEQLSNWYVRRSRKRFSAVVGTGQCPVPTENKDYAFQTLHYVLAEYSKLLAPFMPFIAEEIYQNLTDKESVHLENFPVADKNLINKKVSSEMNFVRQVVSLGLAIRAKNSLKIRMPLWKLEIGKLGNWEIKDELMNLIKDELNIKEVEFVDDLQTGDNWICEEDGKIKIALNIEITEELKLEGLAREIVRHIQVMRKEAKYNRDDIILVKYNFIGDGEDVKRVFDDWGDYIKKECLAEEIVFSEELDEGEFDLVKGLKAGSWKIEIGIKK